MFEYAIEVLKERLIDKDRYKDIPEQYLTHSHAESENRNNELSAAIKILEKEGEK